MDPDDLVREIYVDQSIAEKIIGMELSEQRVDIQIRNRVALRGWVGIPLLILTYASGFTVLRCRRM